MVLKIRVKHSVSNHFKIHLGFKDTYPVPTPTVEFPLNDSTIENQEIYLHRGNLYRNGKPQGIIFLIDTTAQLIGTWQILGTTTKTTFDTNFSNLTGPTFFRDKALKGDINSNARNVVVV